MAPLAIGGFVVPDDDPGVELGFAGPTAGVCSVG
jgi:hypothetical protein